MSQEVNKEVSIRKEGSKQTKKFVYGRNQQINQGILLSQRRYIVCVNRGFTQKTNQTEKIFSQQSNNFFIIQKWLCLCLPMNFGYGKLRLFMMSTNSSTDLVRRTFNFFSSPTVDIIWPTNIRHTSTTHTTALYGVVQKHSHTDLHTSHCIGWC